MRRKRHLSARSRYPAPHREGRRLTKRELRRRIVFWALLTALAVVAGYSFYKSWSSPGPVIKPTPVDLASPTGLYREGMRDAP